MELLIFRNSDYFRRLNRIPMHSSMPLASQLQLISRSFIEASFYDPTTYYIGEIPFDRDEFKRLKKEGLIELSFQNQFGKRYTLSNKGKEYIKRA
jgi:hypothetical protein